LRRSLSTVRHGDQILEQGTHPQLLAANGRYAELNRLRLTWDDEEIRSQVRNPHHATVKRRFRVVDGTRC
jgi:hypothetical protein